MPSSSVAVFTDPFPYQRAIRSADIELCVTAKGDFRAELTPINLHRLWMLCARESLPRVYRAAMNPKRAVIVFLSDANQAPTHHSGMEVQPSDIIVDGVGSTIHHRSRSPCHWRSMSLPPEDLAAAGQALAGREVTVPSVSHLVRPAAALMSRLLNLHETAERLAKTAPDILANPEVARALEQALVHAMIACLTEGTPVEISAGGHHHAAIMARLEELLAANHDRSLYLAEICAATRTSVRTLQVCCQDYLGMSPIRYLSLRRMHLVRRALVLAAPATATVTEIATQFGFFELGRFSVEYRRMFGEAPSASLRRPPADRPISHDSPFALPAA